MADMVDMAYGWSIPGQSKNMITAYYTSMASALDAVDKAKDIRFSETCKGKDQSCADSSPTMDRGEPLPEFVDYCRHYSAPYLGERTSTIAALSAQIQGKGLHAVSMKRHAIWAKQGNRLNPHKVLRGQLSTAWRKTVREQRSSTMGRLAIVLNLAVSHSIPTEQIIWSTAATLALAEIARHAGRSVDIYGVSYSALAFEGTPAHVVCIPLLLSSQVWSIHNTAIATSPAMFRRFCFRLLEIWQPKLGPIRAGYGFPGRSDQLRQWADLEFSKYVGLPASAIHLGCTQNDLVADMASATRWIQAKIDTIDG